VGYRAAGGPCALCGGDFHLTAPGRGPRAPSVDHITLLKVLRATLGPAEYARAATDTANMRAVHYRCNSAAGARPDRVSARRVDEYADHPSPWRSPYGQPWSRDWGAVTARRRDVVQCSARVMQVIASTRRRDYGIGAI
jgi:hypothetical protein